MEFIIGIVAVLVAAFFVDRYMQKALQKKIKAAELRYELEMAAVRAKSQKKTDLS